MKWVAPVLNGNRVLFLAGNRLLKNLIQSPSNSVNE